jgi:hypothetical protein
MNKLTILKNFNDTCDELKQKIIFQCMNDSDFNELAEFYLRLSKLRSFINRIFETTTRSGLYEVKLEAIEEELLAKCRGIDLKELGILNIELLGIHEDFSQLIEGLLAANYTIPDFARRVFEDQELNPYYNQAMSFNELALLIRENNFIFPITEERKTVLTCFR